jgi:hypothetical protein
MITGNGDRGPRNVTMALGGVLIIVGILFMLGQLFNIHLGRFVWPFYIIVPGVLLFVFALTTGGSASEGLAIFGSVVTMTGILLLYQNTFDHFQSWAYAWALVAPTSIGLGQIIYGSIKDREQMVVNGRRLATIGGVIFLVGAIFFELIIGISGFGLGRLGLGSYAWAILLIGLGVFILLRTWWPGAPTEGTQAPAESEDPTQKLSKLKEMLDEGLIAEAEYEAKKAEILSRM